MSTPGVLLAAPGSGSGKTAAACALMWAMKDRGMRVKACKCGPDYIDPMFHREVLGIDSKNLDLFFSEPGELSAGFGRYVEGADITVVEGVMGYYDGMALDSDRASSYDVARTLGLPVILVLPCRGAALSLAALVRGLAEYRKDSNIRGIILNRVSAMLYPRLKTMLERELKKAGHEIPVVGYLPEDEAFSLESRHLGLVTPQEMENIREKIQKAGEILSRTVDLEEICRIASETCVHGKETKEDGERPKVLSINERQVRVGIALDEAFCFYYRDNLELLESLGCRLIPFSPLRDPQLPGELDGLILGGGYPELYGRQLSENKEMQKAVRENLAGGMPCLAECGGFMYLHEELEEKSGCVWPMAGVIKGRTFPAGKLVRFGYVEIGCAQETAENVKGNSGYLRQGERIRGHEFHYWDSTDNGSDCRAVKPDGRRQWNGIHMKGNLFAGYPHLYLPSLPVFAERFVQACREWKKG